ncbi:MAG: hypothetical protein ABSG90_14085 [Dehalococcoidia bacterium]
MASCTGPLYSCGTTVNWQTGTISVGQLSQVIGTTLSLMIGATEIFVAKRTRNFSINVNYGFTDANPFLIYSGDGPGLCATINYSMQGTINENYQYTTTVLSFLDTRYNNAIGTETVESITFNTQATTVEFIETEGVVRLPKFLITNATKNQTTNHFIIINGVKTVLKTSTVSALIYGPGNPLIIVWPLPPAEAITLDNDILKYGFYDYNTGGQPMKEQDGGDDFYFTDWMRLIGQANQVADQAEATERYFTYYLGPPGPVNESIGNPGILWADLYNGSIAVDKFGNVCYSAKLGTQIFNFITDGDLPTLTGIKGVNPEFFPVGII